MILIHLCNYAYVYVFILVIGGYYVVNQLALFMVYVAALSHSSSYPIHLSSINLSVKSATFCCGRLLLLLLFYLTLARRT
jgi:hypothetical protein